MISALIMASGLSKRMGQNKLLLPFRERPIIEYTIDVVQKSAFSYRLLIVSDERIQNIGYQKGINVVFNENAHLGQSEAIKVGLLTAKESMGYAFFTGDQPLMDCQTISLLIDEFQHNQNRIIIPCYKGTKGSPVIFPSCLKKELLLIKGDNGGKIVINNHPDMVKYVEIDNPLFLFDID
ncbi:MAG TPA: NTP transferase domain-containing protein, partial [Haloplasmataceae bacterium]